VEIQDENGETLSRYDGPTLGLPFVKLAPAGSVCMRFIDPWGDATFNQAQIEALRQELRVAAEATDDSRRLLELQSLSSFLDGASGVHVYVKFLGD
jgi:hypothetical protein